MSVFVTWIKVVNITLDVLDCLISVCPVYETIKRTHRLLRRSVIAEVNISKTSIDIAEKGMKVEGSKRKRHTSIYDYQKQNQGVYGSDSRATA